MKCSSGSAHGVPRPRLGERVERLATRIRQGLQSVGDDTSAPNRLPTVPARRDASDLNLRGDLQVSIMAALWRLGEAKVDDVRAQQPTRDRSAYTTVQTVMNRLVERGLLVRERRGRAFVYRPRYVESEYLARAIGDRLADAPAETRRAALVSLVEGLEGDELEEIAKLARTVKRRRQSG